MSQMKMTILLLDLFSKQTNAQCHEHNFLCRSNNNILLASYVVFVYKRSCDPILSQSDLQILHYSTLQKDITPDAFVVDFVIFAEIMFLIEISLQLAQEFLVGLQTQLNL